MRGWRQTPKPGVPPAHAPIIKKWVPPAKGGLLESKSVGRRPLDLIPMKDVVLKQAMDIFGTDVLIDEVDGEVVVDVGDDSVVEALYDKWISTWPDGIMEEGGLIYTGVMVQ